MLQLSTNLLHYESYPKFLAPLDSLTAAAGMPPNCSPPCSSRPHCPRCRCRQIKTTSMPIDKKVGFMGAGQMAEALARGLINKGILHPGNIVCTDPVQARKDLFRSFGAVPYDTNMDVSAPARMCSPGCGPLLLRWLSGNAAQHQPLGCLLCSSKWLFLTCCTYCCLSSAVVFM